MLTAIATSWFNWNFELRDGTELVAALNFAWLGEHGFLSIADREFELGREGWHQGNYFLKENGTLLATAEKPNALFRSFRVKFDHKTYLWEAGTAFARSFQLRDGDRVIGSMRPESVFLRDARIDLPLTLALEHKAFLAWLAVLMWRRQKPS